MDLPRKDGQTYREKLARAYPDDERAAPPEGPSGYKHIWAYWLEISGTRDAGFASLAPITYRELKAWADVKRSVYLNPQIVDLIMATDRRFRRVYADHTNDTKEDDGKSA